MYKLASRCLLLMGCLNSLFSLPVPGSREGPLRFLAPDGGVGPTQDQVGRAPRLHRLPEVLGAGTGDGLRTADPDTGVFHPRGMTRKVFSGQGPTVLLNHPWARLGKHGKHGQPTECFWKYCV